MKILKTTFLLLAVCLMTMSGTSSDSMANDVDNTEVKEYNSYDLIAHDKSKLKVISHG